jgi:citrate/tricarballylate utilization protein
MSTDTLKEAGRVMTICNACRYCEGFCAVFRATELRRTFTDGELKYLANLCHNCRDCYYACQYAPPHEFDLNFPKAMAELRVQTYSEFVWPRFLKGLFTRNGLMVTVITLLSIVAVLLTTLIARDSGTIFAAHTGPESFYVIVPYLSMIVPFTLVGLLVLVSFARGVARFWRETGEGRERLWSGSGNLGALWDVLRLKYLDGGGHGCNYPDDGFSTIRRTYHHAVFYGFLLCLAATTVAAIYDHVLHWPSPYPYLSWPVVLGTVGGILIVLGTVGLLYLKTRMDRRPAAPHSMGMDVSFTVLLLLTSLSGLLLLVLRETALMGILLIVHLGFVLAFFLTMPISKFVHGIYRYIALVRHAQEQSAPMHEEQG